MNWKKSSLSLDLRGSCFLGNTRVYYNGAKILWFMCETESRLRSSYTDFSSLRTARKMWACPRTGRGCPACRPLPHQTRSAPKCQSTGPPPRPKYPQCPLGGSSRPRSEPRSPLATLAGTAFPRPSRCPADQGASSPGRQRGARLRCPARISSDLRAPLLAESGKLPAYGGGQGKVISIRGGSLRSQANTDKLCNTGSRRVESFILLGASQPRLCRKPLYCHVLPNPLPPPPRHLPSLSGNSAGWEMSHLCRVRAEASHLGDASGKGTPQAQTHRWPWGSRIGSREGKWGEADCVHLLPLLSMGIPPSPGPSFRSPPTLPSLCVQSHHDSIQNTAHPLLMLLEVGPFLWPFVLALVLFRCLYTSCFLRSCSFLIPEIDTGTFQYAAQIWRAGGLRKQDGVRNRKEPEAGAEKECWEGQ